MLESFEMIHRGGSLERVEHSIAERQRRAELQGAENQMMRPVSARMGRRKQPPA